MSNVLFHVLKRSPLCDQNLPYLVVNVVIGLHLQIDGHLGAMISVVGFLKVAIATLVVGGQGRGVFVVLLLLLVVGGVVLVSSWRSSSRRRWAHNVEIAAMVAPEETLSDNCGVWRVLLDIPGLTLAQKFGHGVRADHSTHNQRFLESSCWTRASPGEITEPKPDLQEIRMKKFSLAFGPGILGYMMTCPRSDPQRSSR